MSNAVSALKGAAFSRQVAVRDAGPTGMITLRGDLGSPEFTRVLTDVTSCGMPEPRQMITQGAISVLWMSPDELMILCSYADAPGMTAKLADGFGSSHTLAINVSDARTVFDLKGVPLSDVLAKLTPANLSPEALPIGEVRRTKIAQVAAGFWFTGEDSAQLICFRSYAPYMLKLLSTAADENAQVGFYSAHAD